MNLRIFDNVDDLVRAAAKTIVQRASTVPGPGNSSSPFTNRYPNLPGSTKKLCRLRPISSPLSRTKTVSRVAFPSVPAAARTSTTRCGVSCAGYAGTAVEKNAPVMSMRVAGPST